jgi:ABC-type glycerol-3-phosphate transport system substrate-binding protein
MKPKNLVFLAALLLIGVIGGLLALRHSSQQQETQRGSISAFFHLYSAPSRETLVSLLEEFSGFYPEVELSYDIEPYQDLRRSLAARLSENPPGADEVLISVLAGRDLDTYAGHYRKAVPWISSAWRLYYDSRRLAALGFSREELTALSASGMDSFTAAFRDYATGSELLFCLGADFYLPWLAWIQHLQLSATGGYSPTGYRPSDWTEGIREWKALSDSGYFNADHEEINFAVSQLAISRGKGLFVLSDGSIYNTYPPRERIHLDSLPFPGAETGNWQVGSSFYLGVFSGARDKEDDTSSLEELLLDYLFSEGVRDRFLSATGIPLLPRSDSRTLREIPSLTQKVDDPQLQELLKYLK